MMAAGFGASWASPPVMRYLLHKGADIHLRTKTGGTILHVACEFGAANMDVLRFLIDTLGYGVNQADDDGATPLHALLGRNGLVFEAFRFLVDRGANVNAASKSGTTILHTLAHYIMFYRTEGVHVLKYLLDKGANPNVQNSQGLTPLALADQNGWDLYKEAWELIQSGNYERDDELFAEQEQQDENEGKDAEEEAPEGELHPDLQDYVDSDTDE